MRMLWEVGSQLDLQAQSIRIWHVRMRLNNQASYKLDLFYVGMQQDYVAPRLACPHVVCVARCSMLYVFLTWGLTHSERVWREELRLNSLLGHPDLALSLSNVSLNIIKNQLLLMLLEQTFHCDLQISMQRGCQGETSHQFLESWHTLEKIHCWTLAVCGDTWSTKLHMETFLFQITSKINLMHLLWLRKPSFTRELSEVYTKGNILWFPNSNNIYLINCKKIHFKLHSPRGFLGIKRDPVGSSLLG